MEITTLIGVISAFALMVIGIIWGGGQLMSFYDLSSVVITIGGTIAATFIAYTLKDITSIIKIAGNAFSQKEGADINKTISIIIDMANVARKEGLLALEESVKQTGEPFLEKGILLVVDGNDPELVKDIMSAEISSIEARHSKGAGMFSFMASMGPAFGMLGTLIGLINMLKNLSDPDALGPGMAVALVTTFYGSVIANCLCIPLAAKLKLFSSQEVQRKEIMLEGILSIQAGENPRIIEEKLYSFLPRVEKPSAAAASGDE